MPSYWQWVDEDLSNSRYLFISVKAKYQGKCQISNLKPADNYYEKRNPLESATG